MVSVILNLPLWNGPLIFFGTFRVPKIEMNGGDLVQKEDPVPPKFGPWETDYTKMGTFLEIKIEDADIIDKYVPILLYQKQTLCVILNKRLDMKEKHN